MWAGCASVGRVTCQVSRVCVCGQGDISGGPGVRPWAGHPVRWAWGASVGNVSCQVGWGCVSGLGWWVRSLCGWGGWLLVALHHMLDEGI